VSRTVHRNSGAVDTLSMRRLADTRYADGPEAEVDYCGYQIRVRSPHLAALLNGSEDGVQVQCLAPDDALQESAAEAGDAGATWREPRERQGGVVVEFRRRGAGC
jgi:hypothetical protein